MRSLGKVDCRSLGNQKLVLQATAEDGTAADVRMDAEGHILVTEDFRGWVDLQAGGQKVQIAVGLPGVPTEMRYPEPPTVDVTMLRSSYEMPTPAEVYGRWAQESPPSSKRGARAAHGRKPWQGGGWRASAARR